MKHSSLSGPRGAPDGRQGKTPSERERFPGWVIAALVGLHIVLAVTLFDPKIHTGGDNLTYVLLAESLLRSGDGYALSMAPGPPQPQTQYPPGYPLLLAPILLLLGRNFIALKLLSLVLTASSVVAFSLFARQGRDKVSWLTLSVVFAVNPLVIDYSHWVLSEAAFLCCTVAAIWLLRKDEKNPNLGWPFALALAAQIFGFYIRQIGALLLVGTSLAYLCRREWKKFWWHGFIGAGLTVPWLVRSHLVSGTATPYLSEFRLRNIYAPEEGQVTLLDLIARGFGNAWTYVTAELPRALVWAEHVWWNFSGLMAIVAMVVALFAGYGIVLAIRKRRYALAFYVILTGVAISLFQAAVADVRYLLPLVPLILVFAHDGMEGVGTTAAGREVYPYRGFGWTSLYRVSGSATEGACQFGDDWQASHL